MTNLLRYRDLIWTLVVRDLKVRYRRSTIGFLWTMLQPLLTMTVLAMVFGTVFRFEVDNYPVYALSGLLFWNFFQQSVVASMNSLRSNASIHSKVPVPLEIFPVSTVISGVINLAFALLPLFVILLATGHRVGPELLFLPVAMLLAAAFTLGAGLLLSPLAVFFSDVVELVGVAMMLLFYLTPVIYPEDVVEGQWFYWVIESGPVRPILQLFRAPIYEGVLPAASTVGVCVLLAIVALGVGTLVFRRSSDLIPFYI